MPATSGQAAVANADQWHSYPPGYCLKWVRAECWGVASLYASAIDAWDGARYKHPGDRNPPEGAPCYYRGGTYGHIVIARRDDGRMRSTDSPATGQVSNADLDWPEHVWGQTYLGWTEDLNGVRLPLTTDQPPPEEDDVPKFARMRKTKPQTVGADKWVSVAYDTQSSGDAGKPGESYLVLGKSPFVVTLQATVTPNNPLDEVIRTRFIERQNKGNGWETVEEYPAQEHKVTSGKTYLVDSRAQNTPANTRLVAQVYMGSGGVIASADLTALYF